MAVVSAQQRAYGVLHELSPSDATYRVARALRWSGALDATALRAAIAQVVAAHPILRTRFAWRDGELHPLTDDHVPFDLTLHDAVPDDDTAQRARLRDLVSAPMLLAAGPLLRVHVIPTGADTILAVVLHPIVADAASLTLIARALGERYGALTQERPAEPIRRGASYADCARAQAAFLASPEARQHGAYWEAKLGGEISVIDLPSERGRPRTRSSGVGECHVPIASTLVDRVARTAAALGVARDTLVLGAYLVLIHRYTGHEDIVIGCAAEDPARALHPDVVGPFESYLPLRVALAADVPVATVARRVEMELRAAAAHAVFPLPAIVQRLGIAHDPSRAPLFQCVFSGERTDPGLLPFAWAARGRVVASDQEIALPALGTEFDLGVAVRARAGGLALTWRYSTDLFEAAPVERMAGQCLQLLASIVESPGTAVAALRMSPPTELTQVTRTWNATGERYPEAACVHDLVAAQAARTPDGVALVAGAATLTYGQLERRANGLAHVLRTRGVGPDTMVGLHGDRSIEMVIAILAILKAGGAYVPLDPAHPAPRIAYMIADCRIALVLTDAAHHAQLASDHPGVVALDVATVVDEASAAPAPRARPEDLVYVIYTSGSTGTPKGVMIPHRAVVAMVSWVVRRFQISPADRLLQSRSLGFDVSVWEMMGALFAGATLVIARENDVATLARITYEQHVTVAAFVPSELEYLLGEARFRDSPLRVIATGDEVVLPALCQRILAAKPVDLSNNYCPTETTITSTSWTCVPHWDRATVPIGPPIGNVTVYVLDADLAPVPVGVPGELYIGGLGLARGYVGLPALTATKFVPDPYSGVAGARMYRTGDRARWTPDGAIDFLGRADDQVKIRGFRIELGEVETVLGTHPALRAVVVVARQFGPGDRRLVAYATLAPGATAPSVAALRAHVQARLPDYMVPAAFLIIDAIPMTPNGKVDRRRLPAPDLGRGAGDDYLAPRTPIEEHVAVAFGQVLGVPRVGATHHFFELGGNSLLAVQVRSVLEARLSVSVPIATLFRAPTVEALARELAGLGQGAPSRLVTLRSGPSRAPLICVHPLSGSVFCYHPLVARLAAGRACLGLEARGLESDEAVADSITAMTEDYARLVEATHGARPVHLLGWSLGGVLALELSSALAARGIPVESTILLDSYAPATYASDSHDVARLLHLFSYQLQIDAKESDLRALGPERALAHVLALGYAARRIPEHLGLRELTRRFGVYAGMMRASARYEMRKTVPGRVVFVHATEKLEDRGVLYDSADGWPSELWSRFEVHTVPGSHGSIVEPPFVSAVARVVDGVLG